ncbi:hypothetical protein [Rickettsiella grylli]|uniref:Cyclodipeptide synthase n=1 Tax=Rickettsiella grylli TaxID=59196 RepID=A8PPP3_9COXI|nr:hypothetical protein [Rickettsiella grylli]EDP45806.1 hypothetical protein RICGR_1349 [Rickettsiella grylli]
MLKNNNNSIKAPSYRIAHCGNFPNYYLNGVSFHEKNLIYLVSVGKEKFENKWVERFVNFVKEVKPQKVLIVVADSLQRFNIEVDDNIDPKEAFTKSIKQGEKWVMNYKPLFSSLTINYEFVHWEALKEDKDFEHYFHEIKKLDEEDNNFKEALEISSKEYTHRPSRVIGVAYQKAEENSRQFLIEECAVFHVLAKDKENLAIVYPGAVTNILHYAIKHINENNRTKEHAFHWLDLRPTKTNKKCKNIESTVQAPFNSLFFRSLSLNETQSSQQTYQNVDKNSF